MDRLTIGGILLGLLIGLAVNAAILAPRDPIFQDLDAHNLSPGQGHPLGTDALGRDVLSRLAYGARVSLTVALLATALSCLIGTLVGLAAGIAGGRADRLLMRFVDLMLAFPTLVLLLVLAALFQSDGRLGVILIIGLTTWMPLARLVRGQTMSLATERFVEAATGLGATPGRIAVRHLAPNVASTILIAATLLVGDVLIIEAGLSYLGLGIAPPTPTWGDMVRQGMEDLAGAWWVAVFPGLTLSLAVVGFNLLGDGVRDALEPDHRASPRPTGLLFSHRPSRDWS